MPASAAPASVRRAAIRLLADRWAVQIDAYTWRRYALIERFLPYGPINALNIGTGGGVETVRLLRRGNRVTTINIDDVTARRTRARAARWGYADRHEGIVGHILQVDVTGPFQLILMAEVLEHIADDFGALRRIAGWLAPGGRLVLSTPTASDGMLPGDTLGARDGGHVAPAMTVRARRDVGAARARDLRRIYPPGSHAAGSTASSGACAAPPLAARSATRSAFCRPLMPRSSVGICPSDQITIAAAAVT
jgi:2-polyprenyl-3-methyl-5-hydroxy-6-metoxy-1,4-benzoquinol methylase